MEFELRPLDKHHAIAILGWQYPTPYDVYNFGEDNRQADLSYLLAPQNNFFAILNQYGNLEGYCSFGADGQVPGGDYSQSALDIGMGIRPDLIGQGNGKRYALAVARYGGQHYQITQLRVTIAEFNQRAQRVWQSLGFQTVETFYKTDSREKFVVMVGCSTMPLLNGYTIRPYISTDETQWLRCRVLAFLDSAYFDDVKRAKPQYDNPTIELVAIAPDDTVVGFIDIECATAPGTVCSDRPGLGGMIWDLGVHPDYRRRGVARALLDRAVAIAQALTGQFANQRSLVRLEAWTRDDSSAWYQRQGFQRIQHYLHVYLQGAEAIQTLTSSYPGIQPVWAFAHCNQPDKFDAIRSRFQRVHDCQLFELRLP